MMESCKSAMKVVLTPNEVKQWCIARIKEWQRRMVEANIYWSKHVGSGRDPPSKPGVGSDLDARIDSFLLFLKQLAGSGLRPSMVTLVDSTVAQPWFKDPTGWQLDWKRVKQAALSRGHDRQQATAIATAYSWPKHLPIDEKVEAYRDSYESNMPGGPYTPPQVLILRPDLLITAHCSSKT